MNARASNFTVTILFEFLVFRLLITKPVLKNPSYKPYGRVLIRISSPKHEYYLMAEYSIQLFLEVWHLLSKGQ